MKQSNDVFFFTLVDFLAQVLFFGLLLFVVYRAAEARRSDGVTRTKIEADKLTAAAGVSNLTELTDYLTKMAPLDHLRGNANFIQHAGGFDKVRGATEVVDAAGGLEDVKAKLHKYDEAYGLPPCKRRPNGKPDPIATIELHDEHIEFQYPTPALNEVLNTLDTNYAAVQYLSLTVFRDRFREMRTVFPKCRHYVNVRVKTKLLEPVESVHMVGFETYGYSKE